MLRPPFSFPLPHSMLSTSIYSTTLFRKRSDISHRSLHCASGTIPCTAAPIIFSFTLFFSVAALPVDFNIRRNKLRSRGNVTRHRKCAMERKVEGGPSLLSPRSSSVFLATRQCSWRWQIYRCCDQDRSTPWCETIFTNDDKSHPRRKLLSTLTVRIK